MRSIPRDRHTLAQSLPETSRVDLRLRDRWTNPNEPGAELHRWELEPGEALALGRELIQSAFEANLPTAGTATVSVEVSIQVQTSA
jgi:hypothetical protein